MSDVKYPNVTVRLVGEDGNAMVIMGLVSQALKKAGASKQEIATFRQECMSGDYDNLLRVCMEWVNVE